MTFHPSYREAVLQPDYDFARDRLLPLFLDALAAHALDLERSGTPHAREAVRALKTLRDFQPPAYDPAVPDLFFALDRELAARSPRLAGALRTALSRNDLDMTVYRLSAREHLMRAMADVARLRRTLLSRAARERETVMVAFTHHRPAQPTTLGHYLAAVENVLARDTARLRGAMRRLNRCPLGAVALAGSGHPLDRAYTAKLLGFDGPIENTFDAVSAGDWQAEIGGAVGTCAVNLSRFLYDLLNWASQGLITLADGLVQGSSVMPQKRNPVALEHARARLSKCLGYAQAVVFCGHNVPFGDVNDVGTDVQEPLALVWRTFGEGLDLLNVSLSGMTVHRERWRDFAERSESTLTELADELARLCGDFRRAHRVARELLEALRARGRSLSQATDDDVRALDPELRVPDGTVAAALSVDAFVARRTTLGGPAREPMNVQFEAAEERLREDEARQEAWARQFEAARQALAGA